MDQREARTIAEELAKSILAQKNIHDALYKITRVLSYLISEQDGREQLMLTMKQMSEQMARIAGELWGEEKKTGLVHEIRASKKQSEKNERWLRTIAGSLVVGLVLEVVRLLWK